MRSFELDWTVDGPASPLADLDWAELSAVNCNCIPFFIPTQASCTRQTHRIMMCTCTCVCMCVLFAVSSRLYEWRIRRGAERLRRSVLTASMLTFKYCSQNSNMMQSKLFHHCQYARVGVSSNHQFRSGVPPMKWSPSSFIPSLRTWLVVPPSIHMHQNASPFNAALPPSRA